MPQFTVTLFGLDHSSLGVGTLAFTPGENDMASIDLSVTSGTLSGFTDKGDGTISHCNNDQTTCISFTDKSKEPGLKVLFLNAYGITDPITVQAAVGFFLLFYNRQKPYYGILGGGGISTA
jgi:hypothetical protein